MTTTSEQPKVTGMKLAQFDRPIAPPLPDLNPAQELALLARCLYAEGFDDHLAGHITYRLADGTFMVNPFGLTWDEIRASDVARMDEDGHQLEGPWPITPAITLHVELHRARPGTRVAIHNHCRWSTMWADMGRAPEIYDQTGALYHGGVAIYKEYWGPVDNSSNARAAVAAIGDANIALLANHGVLVVADDVEQAYLRAASFEWRCRQAWHIAAVGGGVPMNPEAAANYGEFFNHNNFIGMFAAMARRELRRDPTILD
ncbi:MAG TPA: class II aldolase/adducin family protein [Acidimicrobiales bacterium]